MYKRYCKTESKGYITDLIFERQKDQLDGSEKYLDEVESPADVWINGKCIQHESGLYNFKLVDNKIVEVDNSDAINLYNYNKDLEECLSKRRQAYDAEADPLRNECAYDGVDEQVWRDKVAEIKLRYPKPVMP